MGHVRQNCHSTMVGGGDVSSGHKHGSRTSMIYNRLQVGKPSILEPLYIVFTIHDIRFISAHIFWKTKRFINPDPYFKMFCLG